MEEAKRGNITLKGVNRQFGFDYEGKPLCLTLGMREQFKREKMKSIQLQKLRRRRMAFAKL